MERTQCVICLSDTLSHLYKLDTFPYTFLPTSDDVSGDTFITLNIFSCDECGCAQLKDLVDPALLYGTPHNTTQETPTWKEHHIQFAEFVSNSMAHTSILEIGGYSGVLSNLMLTKRPDISYTIMDLCDENPNIDNVQFIHGNCETITIQDQATVVLSHVFEHLYNPNQFIRNMRSNNITNIIISIPNMKALINKKLMPIIHQEHTFFCGEENVLYLFSKIGYSCTSTYFYKDHSIFFNFMYTAISPVAVPSTKQLSVDLYQIYEYNKTHISNIVVHEPFFIVPAGLYGQLIYYFLKDTHKEHMIGFLDNDPCKIGKRLYGTTKPILKMNTVAEYPAITVIIFNAPYTAEIIRQLDSYNTNIHYIYI